MAARKARTEGAAAQPAASKPVRPSSTFRALIEQFKAAHPDKWEELRLCPLQHGVEAMAEALEKL